MKDQRSTRDCEQCENGASLGAVHIWRASIWFAQPDLCLSVASGNFPAWPFALIPCQRISETCQFMGIDIDDHRLLGLSRATWEFIWCSDML